MHLNLEAPCPWKASTEELEKAGRLQPTTIAAIKGKGADRLRSPDDSLHSLPWALTLQPYSPGPSTHFIILDT